MGSVRASMLKTQQVASCWPSPWSRIPPSRPAASAPHLDGAVMDLSVLIEATCRPIVLAKRDRVFAISRPALAVHENFVRAAARASILIHTKSILSTATCHAGGAVALAAAVLLRVAAAAAAAAAAAESATYERNRQQERQQRDLQRP